MKKNNPKKVRGQDPKSWEKLFKAADGIPEPEPCEFCGRVMLAGVCCEKASEASEKLIMGRTMCRCGHSADAHRVGPGGHYHSCTVDLCFCTQYRKDKKTVGQTFLTPDSAGELRPISEHHEILKSEERLWRALVRIEEIIDQKLYVVVPAWNPRKTITLKLNSVPAKLVEIIKQNSNISLPLRVHAKVNIGADEKARKLTFTDWEFEEDIKKQTQEKIDYSKFVPREEYESACKQLVGLVAALQRYGRHDGGCLKSFYNLNLNSSNDCTCGLDKTLALGSYDGKNKK